MTMIQPDIRQCTPPLINTLFKTPKSSFRIPNEVPLQTPYYVHKASGQSVPCTDGIRALQHPSLLLHVPKVRGSCRKERRGQRCEDFLAVLFSSVRAALAAPYAMRYTYTCFKPAHPSQNRFACCKPRENEELCSVMKAKGCGSMCYILHRFTVGEQFLKWHDINSYSARERYTQQPLPPSRAQNCLLKCVSHLCTILYNTRRPKGTNFVSADISSIKTRIQILYSFRSVISLTYSLHGAESLSN